jgi:hypothetical protein
MGNGRDADWWKVLRVQHTLLGFLPSECHFLLPNQVVCQFFFFGPYTLHSPTHPDGVRMESYTLRLSEEIPDRFRIESTLESLPLPILHTQTLRGKSPESPDRFRTYLEAFLCQYYTHRLSEESPRKVRTDSGRTLDGFHVPYYNM